MIRVRIIRLLLNPREAKSDFSATVLPITVGIIFSDVGSRNRRLDQFVMTEQAPLFTLT